MPNNKNGRSKRPLLIVLVALILVGGLTAIPRFLSPSGESTTPTTDGWQTYTSTKYGFSLDHPQDWFVDDTQFAKNQQILVINPEKTAFVQINAYQDSTINSLDAVRSAIDRVKIEMKNDSKVKLDNFVDSMADAHGGFVATGQQTKDDGVYHFENRGLFAVNGKILMFLSATKDATNSPSLTRIVESFSLK